MSLDFEGHKLSEIYWKQENFWVRNIISVFSLHLGNHNFKTTPCWIGKKPKVSHGGRCHGSRTCPARLWKTQIFSGNRKKGLEKRRKVSWMSSEKRLEKTLRRNIPSKTWQRIKTSQETKWLKSSAVFFHSKILPCTKQWQLFLSNITLEPRIAWFPPKIFK